MSNTTDVCPPNKASVCTFTTCPEVCSEIEYLPTVAGNLAFLIVFAMILLAQLLLGGWYRTWGFLVAIVCGLILQIVGYIGRLLLHNNPFSFRAFVIYLVPLTIGPVFLTAGIYLCLSRIVLVYGQSLSRLHPRVISIVFVASDIISLILQAAGGAIAASNDNNKKASNTGINIMIAGLAWQVLSLVIFMGFWADYIWRCHKAPEESKGQELRQLRVSFKRFRWFQYALWLATTLILIRSVYRVVELQGGFHGVVANNQTALMILEGPMIIIATLVLTLLHPGYAFAGYWSEAAWSFRSRDHGDQSTEK